ncbi:MAG: ABC transporter ATP-binding protein [bacterium]|nr:ABC transporter ATP-binding protein [bacterium]
MISTKDLEKSFENRAGRTWVLRQVGIRIDEGDFLTIMGPSGAGKTTLLSILGMLDGEFEGEYHFLDQNVGALKPKQRLDLHRNNVGFVFQQYHLIDDLTVAENLELPLSYRNVKRTERQAMVADSLDRFHIVGKKDLFPSQLSGGQQQLVGVARAIIGEPRLLLADEPTGNLHTSQGEEIMELFARLNREGTTIVQVTHSEKNARYGNRIFRLLDGWMDGEERVGNATGSDTSE